MLHWWESITGRRSGGLYAGLYADNGATLLVGVWWEYGDKKTRLN